MERIVAIDVADVSKTFKRHSEPAKTLKEKVISWRKSEVSTFNALKDINFDVAIGESVGILGHNGSGKSTLLKTIAGTIRPNTGSVKVRGRLAALLELGAGFHPDLTGRENVYLNGSVLGFSREKVDEIFDDIVAFAELEEFIHTQVKHYSSGMYARLGFAVAINLEPDVLLVDEVLAVGDEAFQRKCIARINQFMQKGRTLMLVTHSPEQVIDICDRAIVLDHGKMIYSGDTIGAADAYRRSIHGESYSELNLTNNSVASTHCISVNDVTVSSDSGNGVVSSGDEIRIEMDLFSTQKVDALVRVFLHNHENLEVLNLSNLSLEGSTFDISRGAHKLNLSIDRSPLAMGLYSLSLVISDKEQENVYASVERAAKFTVVGDYPDTGRIWVQAEMNLSNSN